MGSLHPAAFRQLEFPSQAIIIAKELAPSLPLAILDGTQPFRTNMPATRRSTHCSAPSNYILGLLAALVAGCSYEAKEVSDGLIVHWNSTELALAWMIPAAGVVFGWVRLLVQKKKISAYLIISISLVSALISLTLYTNKVFITDEEVFDYVGMPWDRQKRGFNFVDVERVSIYEDRESYYSSSSVRVTWVLHMKSGEERHLLTTAIWEAATDLIDEHMTRAGIRLGTDPTTLGFASDDPMVITDFSGEAFRFDSANPKERLTALCTGSSLGDMVSVQSGNPLRSAWNHSADVLGQWSTTLTDGPKKLRMQMEFVEGGKFIYTTNLNEKESVLEGTYTLSQFNISLEFDGMVASLTLN